MKKIDVGQIIGIMANLGVIAGIVFLGIELHQNQLVGRTQTQTAIADARRELTESTLSGPMVPILIRRQRQELLTAEEEMRLALWADMWMKHFANVFYQSRQGLYDDEEYDAYLRELAAWIRDYPRVGEYFCRNRLGYSDSFAALVDSMLEDPCDK